MENNLTSKLHQHKYKKGLIQPPMNTLDNKQPAFWTHDRLPEYLWLGLILMNGSRTQGMVKAGKILKKISTINKNIIKPKLSIILNLPNDEQEKIYQIICEEIKPSILSPLTVLFRNDQYPLFNQYFYNKHIYVNKRIDILNSTIKRYYGHQSNESTDLRYVVLSMLIFQDKLKIAFEGSQLAEALMKYPYTEHSDEKMRFYRPSIRSTEIIDINTTPNYDYINSFWKEIGMLTDCQPIVIKGKKINSEIDFKKYVLDFQEKLNYLILKEKEKCILDNKFDVIIGTSTYILRIFNDILEKDLDTSILARLGIRTIIESFINIKYLLKTENEHENIWEEYKLYGLGKYKYVLLKSRELNDTNEDSHFSENLIDIFINEILWEEFVDIDLRYFDNKKIKDKFEDVDEADLYNISYEYNNNFSHGFWGAIRESSMLCCNNSSHKYHLIPDVNFEQEMTSVNYDIYIILEKLSKIIENEF
ncbi:DUF5677 domain-containing protein [Aliarcobacter lanthieri]|uniref:DUF5677 domain-containing protein n=1 Tax=Aliarcobacter lanthieri TaxID=1355374 RepID=UPI003AAC237F